MSKLSKELHPVTVMKFIFYRPIWEKYATFYEYNTVLSFKDIVQLNDMLDIRGDIESLATITELEDVGKK